MVRRTILSGGESKVKRKEPKEPFASLIWIVLGRIEDKEVQLQISLLIATSIYPQLNRLIPVHCLFPVTQEISSYAGRLVTQIVINAFIITCELTQLRDIYK